MAKGTITIKRSSGTYDQLWYVNSDGYPQGDLGEDIFKYLKTTNDVERAVVIFRKEECYSILETSLMFGEEKSIKPILNQGNDYSYVFDEKTGKWGFYEYKKNKLKDLEAELKKKDDEDDDSIGG